MFKRKKIKPLLLSTAVLLSMNVHADEIPAIDCMIEPNVMVELSSPVSGVLDTINVDKSDEVKIGQLVATLKSDLESVGVQTSAERLKLSDIEYKRAVSLYRENAITLSEKDRSENEKKLLELELKQAKATLDLRQITSPINGVVVKRYAMPGEFVETKPILQLAQLDPLKIEVVSPVSNYGKIFKGMQAKISPEFGEYENLIAEVVVVDKVIDAASGTFGVRLELANKDYAIPGGLKCQINFLDKAPVAKKQTTAADKFILPAEVTQKSSIVTAGDRTTETLLCSSVGPYKAESDRKKVLARLGAEIEQVKYRRDETTKTTYLVTSKVFSDERARMEAMKSMKAAGITDMARLAKDNRYRIALGLYSQQSSANNRLTELKKKGYPAKLDQNTKIIDQFWADIMYSPEVEKTIAALVPETSRSACEDSVRLGMLD